MDAQLLTERRTNKSRQAIPSPQSVFLRFGFDFANLNPKRRGLRSRNHLLFRNHLLLNVQEMKNRRILCTVLFCIFCNLFIVEARPADSEVWPIYISFDGTRSQITTEERNSEFLKSHIPSGIEDGRINWGERGRPYAQQKSIKMRGGFIVTSTRYLKNCTRIITISRWNTPDNHRVVFYQDSRWPGGEIEPFGTKGVKMAIGAGGKSGNSFVVISTYLGELTVTLPEVQGGAANQQPDRGELKFK